MTAVMTTTQDAMSTMHETRVATALGKRPLEQCVGGGDDDGVQLIKDSNPSPKRLRCDSPAPPAPESDGLFVWNGIECDPEDIACRDRIAFVANDDASPVSDLVVVLTEATSYQVELAMLRLFASTVAFSRICRALVLMPSLRRKLDLDAVVYRAAHENRPRIVATMLRRLCKEDDVERALLTAVEEDDLVAVEAIDMARRNDSKTPQDSYQRLARGALYEAAQTGRAAIVAYLVGVCDHDAIDEALSMCINAGKDEDLDSDEEGDEEGDRKARVGGAKGEVEATAKTVAVFAALWEHAEACAHRYVATLAPCAIRDYLVDRIAQGEPCADSCMSNLSDDSDEEDEEEDGDSDHNGDGEDDSTTDDGGRCDEDGDAQGDR